MWNGRFFRRWISCHSQFRTCFLFYVLDASLSAARRSSPVRRLNKSPSSPWYNAAIVSHSPPGAASTSTGQSCSPSRRLFAAGGPAPPPVSRDTSATAGSRTAIVRLNHTSAPSTAAEQLVTHSSNQNGLVVDSISKTHQAIGDNVNNSSNLDSKMDSFDDAGNVQGDALAKSNGNRSNSPRPTSLTLSNGAVVNGNHVDDSRCAKDVSNGTVIGQETSRDSNGNSVSETSNSTAKVRLKTFQFSWL